MLPVLIGLSAVLIAVISWMLWSRFRAQKAARPDVIYLGYDDKDNVGSMREAMLERIRRGGIDP